MMMLSVVIVLVFNNGYFVRFENKLLSNMILMEELGIKKASRN